MRGATFPLSDWGRVGNRGLIGSGIAGEKRQEAGQYIGVIELFDGVGEFVGLGGVGIRHGCLR